MDSTSIEEVARKAGVSKSTVSRVINHPELVKSDTRERVLKIIKEMGYSPNQIARSLATGKSGMIALIVPDIMDSTFSLMARGCSDHLAKYNLTLALYNSDESRKREQEIIRLAEERQMDGIILVSNPLHEISEKTNPPKIPTVYVMRKPDHPNIDSVFTDSKETTRLACQHLLEFGHRRIAIVTGLLNTFSGRELLTHFEAYLKDAGIYLPREYVIEGDFKLESGERAAKQFMALKPRPTAVFLASDLTTYTFMSTLQAYGIRVPDEVSIVTSVDLPSSSLTHPRLTAVHCPIYKQGATAASLLVKKRNKPDRPSQSIVLPVKLIVRESTCRLV